MTEKGQTPGTNGRLHAQQPESKRWSVRDWVVKRPLRSGLSCFLLVLLCLLALGPFVWVPARALHKWVMGGENLDTMYSFLHALAEALAFAAVVATLLYQYFDARTRTKQFHKALDQHETDIDNRTKQSKDTLDAQKSEIEAHAQQFRETLFQSTFFAYLSVFNAYVHSLREGSLVGGECLEEWRRRLAYEWKGQCQKEPRECFEQFRRNRQSSVVPYCQHLRNLLQVIECAAIEKNRKAYYTDMLSAQLGPADRLLLYFYCHTPSGAKSGNRAVERGILTRCDIRDFQQDFPGLALPEEWHKPEVLTEYSSDF